MTMVANMPIRTRIPISKLEKDDGWEAGKQNSLKTKAVYSKSFQAMMIVARFVRPIARQEILIKTLALPSLSSFFSSLPILSSILVTCRENVLPNSSTSPSTNTNNNNIKSNTNTTTTTITITMGCFLSRCSRVVDDDNLPAARPVVSPSPAASSHLSTPPMSRVASPAPATG
ncbi:hypothetical protein CLCR_10844 [Cladophialophora carrionii]|uniref:Uncharacterized protein n=1 Tax=Cladophialophora carrionii TaxID=86049 RepID=A0A1C1CXA0_9EURO|nr:hypothetical protein CLCR_10844 [Cladophialophora carrionii]